jgi:hypothetical protein
MKLSRSREQIIAGDNGSDSEVEFIMEIRAPPKRIKLSKPLPPNVQVIDVEEADLKTQ